MRAYRQTEAYQKALRKRQVWVEPLFGEAKQWREGARFRVSGSRKVNIQGLLNATRQNLKRLLRCKEARTSPGGTEATAIQFLYILQIGVGMLIPRLHLTFSTRWDTLRRTLG